MSPMSKFLKQLFGRRAKPDLTTRLGCEGLEVREMPAIDFELPTRRGPLIQLPTDTSVPVAVEGGNLVIRGTASADTITVTETRSIVEVTVNGRTTVSRGEARRSARRSGGTAGGP